MTREEAIEIVRKHGISADGTKFESALRELIPELRDSEDERIRKAIVSLVYESQGTYKSFAGIDLDDMLAYLEKQKEEEGYEAIPVESTLEYKLGFKAGKKSEKQKEQKSVDYEAELKKCKDNPLYFYDKYVSIKQKPKAKAKSPLSPHELYDAKIEGISQGRQDVIDNPEVYGLIKMPRMFERKPAKCNECAMFLLGECTHPDGKCKNAKPKQERSEEDDKDFEDCLTELACELYEQRDESPENTAFRECEVLKKWTPILLKKVQQKAGWSEEDERMLSRCIKSVDCSKQFAESETFKKAKDVEITWLKSLPLSLKKKNEAVAKLCSNEWSEEDENIYKTIMDDFNGITPMSKAYKLKAADFLKSLKLQVHWKPSEHQMNILQAVKEYVGRGSGYWGEGLGSLIEDLKKL